MFLQSFQRTPESSDGICFLIPFQKIRFRFLMVMIILISNGLKSEAQIFHKGVVVDENFKALVGVKITFSDYNEFYYTDSSGNFQLPLNINEISDSTVVGILNFNESKIAVFNISRNANSFLKVKYDKILNSYLTGSKRINMPKSNIQDVQTLTVLEAGNSLPPGPLPPLPKIKPIKQYTLIPVFFATDRNKTTNSNPNITFGGKRSDALKYGYCNVSLPNDHEIGELESPTWWRFEFRENPNKHVVLMNLKIVDKLSFFSNVALNIKNDSKKSALIFIHGYNVTFQDAARRTAQLSYDLRFKGLPIFYSWPSLGNELKYKEDEGNIEWTGMWLGI